jgi:Uma2 family endonuclease
MATMTGTRLKAEEFEHRYADVDFCELERGEVVELTAGGWRHSAICFKVGFLLGDWARRTRLGRVLTGEAGLVTGRDPDTVRGVDVMYYSFERVAPGQEPESFAEIAPNLAVEVVGKGQGWRKMTEKAAEYLRLGADRVWVIDPRNRTLHVFHPDQPPRELKSAEVIVDEQLLPGFSCKLAELFEN